MEGVLKSLRALKGTEKKEAAGEEQFSVKLSKDIAEVTSRLTDLRNNFNNTDNEDLIEAMIYEELSLKARYSYLIRLAKEHNITNDKGILS